MNVSQKLYEKWYLNSLNTRNTNCRHRSDPAERIYSQISGYELLHIAEVMIPQSVNNDIFDWKHVFTYESSNITLIRLEINELYTLNIYRSSNEN